VQGPAFDDLVLEHVERTYQPPESSREGAAAEAYNYIPTTVLGDFFHEVRCLLLRAACAGSSGASPARAAGRAASLLAF
jgi:hypothetical protein